MSIHDERKKVYLVVTVKATCVGFLKGSGGFFSEVRGFLAFTSALILSQNRSESWRSLISSKLAGEMSSATDLRIMGELGTRNTPPTMVLRFYNFQTFLKTKRG